MKIFFNILEQCCQNISMNILDMFVPTTGLVERLVTVRTDIRSFPGMDVAMVLKVLFLQELFSAKFARVASFRSQAEGARERPNIVHELRTRWGELRVGEDALCYRRRCVRSATEKTVEQFRVGRAGGGWWGVNVRKWVLEVDRRLQGGCESSEVFLQTIVEDVGGRGERGWGGVRGGCWSEGVNRVFCWRWSVCAEVFLPPTAL